MMNLWCWMLHLALVIKMITLFWHTGVFSASRRIASLRIHNSSSFLLSFFVHCFTVGSCTYPMFGTVDLLYEFRFPAKKIEIYLSCRCRCWCKKRTHYGKDNFSSIDNILDVGVDVDVDVGWKSNGSRKRDANENGKSLTMAWHLKNQSTKNEIIPIHKLIHISNVIMKREMLSAVVV